MNRADNSKLTIVAGIMVVMTMMPLTSCFTGVESTPKITESDVRRAHVTDRPETHYLEGIAPEPFGSWQRGKQFVCTDNRVMRIFGPEADGMKPLGGQTIEYYGSRDVMSITGNNVAELIFTAPEGQVVYRTDVSTDSLRRRGEIEVPFMTELSLINNLRDKLKGNSYYVTTSLWQDERGNRTGGRKYVKVSIADVMAGYGVYPVKLKLETEADGKNMAKTFYLPLTFDTSTGATSTFDKQISLTDPRARYPKISDRNWELITRGTVASGMTRDECRLALGSPAKVERVPGRDTIYERWTYENGVTLTFSDGLLSSYRS